MLFTARLETKEDWRDDETYQMHVSEWSERGGYLSLYTLLVQSPYSVSQQPVTLALSHTIYWSADLIDRFQGQLGTSPQY